MRFLAVLAILASAFAGVASAEDPSGIEPQALSERMESGDTELLVLNVRSVAEFDEGHIPGAINIPHDSLG
ncbi:MAG: hypothetical protein EXR87_03775 [Gammaproteobacteria bacterium]|nr:hypothetical protein [Gammaproteobacteria bacterium]